MTEATAAATTAAATVEATTSRACAGSRPGAGAAAAHLAQLFEAHLRQVLGICRALLRDPEDAEDAAQQVFLSAYRSLLAGTVPRDPAAWLGTIARNECASRARARMREPLAERGSAVPDVHAEAVRAADLEALRSALASLPRQQRAAFLLREISGLSYTELALALGVSGPAVEALLVRARRKLRVALAPARAALAIPLAFRDFFARLFAGGELQFPAAAKLASVSAGVVVMAAGATSLVHHRTPVRHARAAPRPAVAMRRTPAEPRVSAPARPTNSFTPPPRLSEPSPSAAPVAAPAQEQEHEVASPPEREHSSGTDKTEQANHDSAKSGDGHHQSSDSSSSDGSHSSDGSDGGTGD